MAEYASEDVMTEITRLRADLAAASTQAETILRPLVKRHAPVRDDQWGGFCCGTCWTKDGSRPTWPCNESLAIAALLPARDNPEVPGDH